MKELSFTTPIIDWMTNDEEDRDNIKSLDYRRFLKWHIIVTLK